MSLWRYTKSKTTAPEIVKARRLRATQTQPDHLALDWFEIGIIW